MHYRVAAIASALLSLAACATTPAQKDEFLRLYKGAPLPIAEVAILRSADDTLPLGNKKTPVRVELMAIDKQKFSRSGGLGDGVFEVHMLPGTYTLQLRYATVPTPDSGTPPLRSGETEPFTFTAQAGHTYILSGERVVDATTFDASWRPIMFDRTRKLSWSRRESAELADGR